MQPMIETLDSLSTTELADLAKTLEVLDERKRYNLQEFLFPGYLNNPKYKKHLLFLNAGLHYNERAFIAGNRTGKTYTVSMEMSFHANGRYPIDWKGKRFTEPTRLWSVGNTHNATRDILQRYLCGNIHDLGTGMIPKEDIIDTTRKSGTEDAILDIYVRHYTEGKEDGVSQVTFKSYVQGIESFMGEQVHAIHLDEEPAPAKIYSECVTRTMTTNGIVMCTFTPLNGLSQVVMKYLPHARFPLGGYGEVINDNELLTDQFE